MHTLMARALICLALGMLGAQAADAGGITSYFESSANQKPRGNAGVSVSSDRVKLNADVALRAPNRATQIVPQLSSAFAISNRLGVETRVHLSEWNSGAELPGAKVDTRLHFQSSAPFLDELEGRVWRSPDGQSGRILRFGFYQILSDTNALTPVTMRSKASVETTVGGLANPAPGILSLGPRPESRRLGLETEFRGLLARRITGKTALKIKVDKVAGARAQTAQSVAYDHSWSVGNAALGLNLKVLRTTYATTVAGTEPSLGLTWRWDL